MVELLPFSMGNIIPGCVSDVESPRRFVVEWQTPKTMDPFLARILRLNLGGVAQSGEHLLCKQGVRGSNPLTSTKLDKIKNPYAQIWG